MAEPKPQPESKGIFVNGIVSARNKRPYIQLSTTDGINMQLSMAEARKIAYDMLTMCSRTEADAMIIKFFDKKEFPEGAAAAVMMDFRDYRHELDMEQVESSDSDPDTGETIP